MAEAAVSVIIPVRNGAAFIGEALDSVLRQTRTPREIVVVDDGSDDTTASVVASFKTVTLVRQDPGGAGAARNTGVQRATQPLLAFLDADDLWDARKTEIQAQALAEDPHVDIVGGQMVQFRTAGGQVVPLGASSPTTLLPALMIRREVVSRVGPFSTQWRVGETVDWWARALDLGVRHTTLPDVVYWRRLHAGNMGRTLQRPMQDYLRMLHTVVKRRRVEP